MAKNRRLAVRAEDHRRHPSGSPSQHWDAFHRTFPILSYTRQHRRESAERGKPAHFNNGGMSTTAERRFLA